MTFIPLPKSWLKSLCLLLFVVFTTATSTVVKATSLTAEELAYFNNPKNGYRFKDKKLGNGIAYAPFESPVVQKLIDRMFIKIFSSPTAVREFTVSRNWLATAPANTIPLIRDNFGVSPETASKLGRKAGIKEKDYEPYMMKHTPAYRQYAIVITDKTLGFTGWTNPDFTSYLLFTREELQGPQFEEELLKTIIHETAIILDEKAPFPELASEYGADEETAKWLKSFTYIPIWIALTAQRAFHFEADVMRELEAKGLVQKTEHFYQSNFKEEDKCLAGLKTLAYTLGHGDFYGATPIEKLRINSLLSKLSRKNACDFMSQYALGSATFNKAQGPRPRLGGG